MYPVHFECINEIKEVMFTVGTFDSATATVEIQIAVTVESWDEIAAKVREALVMMQLENGKEVTP